MRLALAQNFFHELGGVEFFLIKINLTFDRLIDIRTRMTFFNFYKYIIIKRAL